ncbi:hypothetical protein EXE42_16410, partial [Halorubrum sp. SP3]|uniref:hypothetical protein n=1 Tax=Halorubrum sp. SP3 TaxID=1537265 RepID=UPI0010F67D11
MSTNDVQIALGILQLVALTLPVFALLTQVYLSTEDNRTHVSLGMVLLFGGGVLIVGAIFSAQSLYCDTNSILIELSLMTISLGIIAIGVVLYRIYNTLRMNAVREARSNEDKLDRLIELMEEHEFETVSEFHESNIELDDANKREDLETTTVEDLRNVRKSAKSTRKFFDKGLIGNTESRQLVFFGLISLLLV